MAQKLKLVTNVSNLISDITPSAEYPYFENQQYFTTDGLIFQDKGGRRLLLGTVKISYDEGTPTDDTKLKGTFLLVKTVTGYDLKYVDETGVPQDISSGTAITNYVKKITTNWIINNESTDTDPDNFIIGQTDGVGTVIDKEIFKIFKSDTGGTDFSKVEIKNAKTRIEDLDFGVWIEV